MNNRIYITTSIPYVNADPHIGHALEYVQGDALARYYRLQNKDTYFLAGSDENAIKNVETAKKQNIPIQTFIDQHSQAFNNLKNALNITFDQFIRTSSQKHKQGAARFWELCRKDIYKKTYEGLYCTGCETFYKDGEFKDNICPFHNRKLEIVREENYFFALSKYQDQILKLLDSDTIQIYPSYRKKEVINFIQKGLEDFSISRPEERTHGWGVPVPGDEKQRMYVWFDALTNYITALDFGTDGELYKKYWIENQNRFQIIGKDIIKFHAIYWPAMLISAGQPVPTKLFVHGFINIEGQKMSKSIGNVINPVKVAEIYGIDAVRYYLLREIPSLDDGDYSAKRMEEIYNSELANELGNLVSRITTIAEKDDISLDSRKDKIIENEELITMIEQFEFNKALEYIWNKVKQLNRDVNTFTPWAKSSEERKEFLIDALSKIFIIGIELLPFMPETADKILQATEGKIHKISPLFPRIKK